MIKKGHFHWDRTTKKDIYKFKKKNFPNKSKKCMRCGKRKEQQHHYLCQKCHDENHKRYLERQGIISN